MSQYWTYQINPVSGCRKISEGCQNCYAERTQNLHHAGGSGRGFFDRPFDQVTLRPDQLKKFDHLARATKPQVVFVGNMADLWQDGIPIEYQFEILHAAWISNLCRKLSGQHTFLFLTKRPDNMKRAVEYWLANESFGVLPRTMPDFFWIGVTCENQARADERIPLLLETPAAHRWVSCEPMLGPVDLLRSLCLSNKDHCSGWCLVDDCKAKLYSKIDLVIAGGESGPRARPSEDTWFKSLYDQCHFHGVGFYLKQWGDGFKDKHFLMRNLAKNFDPSIYEQPFIGRVKA